MQNEHEAMRDDAAPEKKPLSPQAKEVLEDVDKYRAIAAILNQEGGKILVESIKSDILRDVDVILGLFKGPEMDLRAAVAKLSVDLNLFRALKHAPENATLAEEALSKLLEEEKEV